jgi:hypothetical protein
MAAEEITLEQEVDLVLGQQARGIVADELVWEPEPFEDQRAFASTDQEDPDQMDEESDETGSGEADMEDEEED